MIKLDFDPEKQKHNIRTHKLDFSFAEHIFADPLAVLVYDRYEGGEHRWHLFSWVGGKLLLCVHSYPDPDDEGRVRVISLREATALERRRHETADPD